MSTEGSPADQIDALMNAGQYDEALLCIDEWLETGIPDVRDRIRVHFDRGICLHAMKRYPEALDSFRAATELCPDDAKDEILEGKILAAAGKSHFELSELEQALENFKRSFELLKESAENIEVASIQKYIGVCLQKLDQLNGARDYFEDSMSSYRRMGQELEVARLRGMLARIYFMKSQWKNSVEYLEEAIKIKHREKSFERIATYLTNLGTAYLFLGDYRNALKNYRKSMRLQKKYGSQFTPVHNHLQLGRLYTLQHDHARAEEHLKKGMELAEEMGMDEELALAYESMGELAFERDEFQRAESCYERAIRVREKIAPESDRINIDDIYRRIGDLRVKMGDLDGAWEMTERSLSGGLGDPIEKALTHRVRGLIWKERGERNESLQYLTRCLKVLESYGDKYEIARTHLEIGILHSAIGDGEEDYRQGKHHLLIASDIFEELGISYYRGRVAIELSRLLVKLGEYAEALERLACAEGFMRVGKDEEAMVDRANEIMRFMEETIVDRVMSMVDDYSFGSIDVPLPGFFPDVSRTEGGLGNTLSSVMERVGADRGFVARSLGTGGRYRAAVTVGLATAVGRDEIERLGTIDERMFMLKRPVLSVDLSRDGRFDSLRDGFLSGATSLMLVPFGVGKNVEGFCYLDRFGGADRGPFLSMELEHLISYSKYMALIVMAIERDELMKDNIYLKAQLDHTSGFENIITRDPRMLDIFGMVGRVRDSTIPVLLMGETGTGKELIARAIHFGGVRKKRKFVAINCAALPDNLLESELFGHQKGAFTGALMDKKGMFEVADGGTFFLDEISDMGLGIQAKLLRVLESGEIKRLGETTGRNIDVRIISATNRDLYKEVEGGRFREDLFYRLNGIRVEIPPLRDRRADIPLLISHFIEKFSVEEGKKISGISPEALNVLLSCDWPGNIRELLNEIRRAVTLAKEGESIGLHLLSDRHGLGQRAREGEEDGDTADTLPQRTASFEKEQIRMALKEANGVKSRAARLLGIHESTLRFKMKRYRLV